MVPGELAGGVVDRAHGKTSAARDDVVGRMLACARGELPRMAAARRFLREIGIGAFFFSSREETKCMRRLPVREIKVEWITPALNAHNKGDARENGGCGPKKRHREPCVLRGLQESLKNVAGEVLTGGGGRVRSPSVEASRRVEKTGSEKPQRVL